MEAVPPDKGCHIKIFTDGIHFDPVEQERVFAEQHPAFPDCPEPYGDREIPEQVQVDPTRPVAEKIPSAGLRQVPGRDHAEINIRDAPRLAPCNRTKQYEGNDLFLTGEFLDEGRDLLQVRNSIPGSRGQNEVHGITGTIGEHSYMFFVFAGNLILDP